MTSPALQFTPMDNYLRLVRQRIADGNRFKPSPTDDAEYDAWLAAGCPEVDDQGHVPTTKEFNNEQP